MKYIIILLVAVTTFAACEKKDYPAGVKELEHHYYAIFVPNNNTGVTVTRSQTALVKFPVQFYSTYVRDYDAVAKYSIFTTGITPPAVAGVDFNVVDKNGNVITPGADGTYSIIFPKAIQAMDTIYLKMLNNAATGIRKMEVQLQDNITPQFDVDIFSTAFRRPVQIN
ncbi:MAG: hypothetical protein ABI480_01300 [Chitinophagaceae bacterium]